MRARSAAGKVSSQCAPSVQIRYVGGQSGQPIEWVEDHVLSVWREVGRGAIVIVWVVLHVEHIAETIVVCRPEQPPESVMLCSQDILLRIGVLAVRTVAAPRLSHHHAHVI